MRNQVLFLALLFSVALLQQSVSAQYDPTPQAVIRVRDVSVVRAGPGNTYPQVGLVRPTSELILLERNPSGTWLHFETELEDNTFAGWVLAGTIRNSEEIDFGELPITTEAPDADLSEIQNEQLAAIYEMPVIPTFSDQILDVYQQGQELGRNPASVTKIGDSLSASSAYLEIFSRDEYQLGPYIFLEPTLLHYQDSTSEPSIAARVGMNSFTVFDPFWAFDERCESNESPIDCEFRVHQPGIALILYGPNDVKVLNSANYETQMRAIVQHTLDARIIPILLTFSVHPEQDTYWQGITFNQILTTIAQDMDVPLINLWAAAQNLPDYGLGEDRVHLTHPGGETLRFDSGQQAYSGIALQNLLVLTTLHELQTALEASAEEE